MESDIRREKLLQAYLADRSIENRNALVEAHVPLVRRLASKMWKSRGVTREDCESCGLIGLIRAIEEFKPSLGVRFSTFAWRLVKHRILDSVKTASRYARRESLAGSKDFPTIDPPQPYDSMPEDEPAFWDDAVKGMASRDRTVVLMRHRQGKTLDDIGKEVGVSKQRVERILEELKPALATNLYQYRIRSLGA